MAVERLLANLTESAGWPIDWACGTEDRTNAIVHDDGDFSYINSETQGAAQGIGFYDTQFIGDDDQINSVTFVVVAKNEYAGDTAIIRVKSHALYTSTPDAQEVKDDFYNEYRFTFAERAPNVPWTRGWVNLAWAELISEADAHVRVTQVYAIVDYVPSVPNVQVEAGAQIVHTVKNVSAGAVVRLPIELPLMGAGAGYYDPLDKGHGGTFDLIYAGAWLYGYPPTNDYVYLMTPISAGAQLAICPQVRRVLTGEILAWSTTVSTVTLSATVDPTKSILFFGFREATTIRQCDAEIGGTFVSLTSPTNQIVFHKGTSDPYVIDALRWWVIEFADGVSVEHKLLTLPGGSLTTPQTGFLNLTTPVAKGRSFCLLSNDPTASTPTAWNNDDFIKVFLSGLVGVDWTNITWETNGTSSTSHHLHVQIVQCDNGYASVQEGVIAHTSGSSVTATLSPTIPKNRLVAFFTSKQAGSSTTETALHSRTCVPNADIATGLTFQAQAIAGGGHSIYWYAIQFHAATVQHYDVSFGAADLYKTVTLTTPVDVRYALPIVHISGHQFSNMRATSATSVDFARHFTEVEWGTVVANKAQTIVISRGAVTALTTALLHLQVVEFVPYSGTTKNVDAGARVRYTKTVAAGAGIRWGPAATLVGAGLRHGPTAKTAGAAVRYEKTATAGAGLRHGPAAKNAGAGVTLSKTLNCGANLAAVSATVNVSAGAGLRHGPTAMAAGAALVIALTTISAGAGVRQGPTALSAGSELQKTNVLSAYTDTWSYYYCTSGTPTDYYAAAFYGASYDKSAWSTGPGIFAWPADGLTGLSAATVGTSSGHHATGTAPPIYIIQDIYIPDKTKLVSLKFEVIYDDGFVFWVNGTELTGSGMPTAGRPTTISGSGTTGFSTLTISSNDEGDVHTYTLTGAMLDAFVTGMNRIAGICLDCNATSTDIGFGVKITATHLASWAHKDVSAGARVQFTTSVAAGAELSGVTLLAGAGLVHGPAAKDAGAMLQSAKTVTAGAAATLYRTLNAGASLPGKEVAAGAGLRIQKDATAGAALKIPKSLDVGASVKTVGAALSIMSDDFSSPAAPSDIDTNKWQEYVQSTAGAASYGHVDDSGTQRGRILGGTGSDQHWMLAKNWTETDYDASVRWKYNSTTSYYVALSVRVGKSGDSTVSGVNNIYLQINPSSSSNNVILQRRYWTTSAQTVAVATGSLAISANTEYRSRIRVSGTNIKAWIYNAAGTAVLTFDNGGAGYDISTTNPSGPPGFKFSHSSETSSDYFTFWDFQINRISSTSQFEVFAGATWSGTVLQYAAGAALLVPSIQRNVAAGAAINTLPAQYCPPMVFGITETLVSVHVEYQAAADQYIEYGPSEAEIAKYTTSTQTNVTLVTQNIPNGEGDFSAGGTVWYRVRARATGSGSYGIGFHHFTQLARSGSDSTPWKWIHVSDSRGETSNTISPKFTDVIQQIFPGAGSDEFLLCTGDLYNPASDSASGITTSTRAWRSGATGWGQYGEKGANLQLKHTFGNHELDSDTAKADARKVRLLLGPCASLAGQQTDGVDSSWKERYYYFTWGGAVFFVLDSYAYGLASQYRMSPAQCTWLTAAMERFKEYRWKFICLHKFVDQDDPNHGDNITSPSGAAANQTFLFNLIKKYGVQIVFNGHYHGWYIRQRNSKEWYVTTNFENSDGTTSGGFNGDVNDKRYVRVRMGLGWNGSSYDVNPKKLTLEITKIDGTITARTVVNTSDSPWTWGEKIVTCGVAVKSLRIIAAGADILVGTTVDVAAGVGVRWSRTPIASGVGLQLPKNVSSGAGLRHGPTPIDAGTILRRTVPVSAGAGIVHGPTAKAAGAMLQQTPSALTAGAAATLYKLVSAGANVSQPGSISVTAGVGVRWTVAPEAGAGIRKGLVTAGLPWVEVGTNALPAGIYSHTTLSYQGKLWQIGGSDGTTISKKVYWSSDFGATWTEAGTNALLEATYSHASVVYDGRMWVFGGTTPTGMSRKASWSIDGATWTEAGTNQLPSLWDRGVALSHDGWIWLIGGYSSQRKQVWRSQDCITWSQIGTDVLPINVYHHAGCVHDGKMWISGGADPSSGLRHKKVFWSTAGSTWTEAGTDALPIANFEHKMISTDGQMWIIGGSTQGGIITRAILSSVDGAAWIEIGVNGLPEQRYEHSALVFRDRMVVTGGIYTVDKRTVFSAPAVSGLSAGAALVHGPAALTAGVAVRQTPSAISCGAGLHHGPAAKVAGAGIRWGPAATTAGAGLRHGPTALDAGAVLQRTLLVSTGAGLLHGPAAEAAGAGLRHGPTAIDAGAVLRRTVPIAAGAGLQAITIMAGASLQQTPAALTAGSGLRHGPAALTAGVGVQRGKDALAGAGVRLGVLLDAGAGLHHGPAAKIAGAAIRISRTPIAAGAHIVGGVSVSVGSGLRHGPASLTAGVAVRQTPPALDAGALPTCYRTVFAGASILTAAETVKTWTFISRVVPYRHWDSRIAESDWNSRTG